MKSKSIEREHLFVCEYCHKINDITNPVEKARADEQEKINIKIDCLADLIIKQERTQVNKIWLLSRLKELINSKRENDEIQIS